MKIRRAYKTELAPNNKQKTMLRQCAGTARFVYNWALAEWKSQYEAGGKPSRYNLCRYFNSIKDEECSWIREIPYAVTEAALYNLGAAFQNFFRRVKNGEKPGYPKFKKKGRDNSFQIRDTRIESDRVRLTHIGWVRLKECGYIPITKNGARLGTYVTISRKAERWFISVQVEEEILQSTSRNGHSLGIDLGINPLAHCSDGTVFENPRALQKEERKLARLQRELARRKKGGQNWKKTKIKIQRCYARIANVRKHALHQVSHYVTAKTKPWAIGLENLNIAGMLQNKHLSKAISSVGLYEERRQIEYKAEWNGIEIVVADRFYPSSKKCSACGHINNDLTLADREWTCPQCWTHHDRNFNAAKNLEPERLLAEGGSTARLPVELVPLGATVKQELGSSLQLHRSGMEPR